MGESEAQPTWQLPNRYRVTETYLLLRAAERFGRPPLEAMATWPPWVQRLAMEYDRLRQAEEHRERLAMLGSPQGG